MQLIYYKQKAKGLRIKIITFSQSYVNFINGIVSPQNMPPNCKQPKDSEP